MHNYNIILYFIIGINIIKNVRLVNIISIFFSKADYVLITFL